MDLRPAIRMFALSAARAAGAKSDAEAKAYLGKHPKLLREADAIVVDDQGVSLDGIAIRSLLTTYTSITHQLLLDRSGVEGRRR